jgi:hypothetical protein
MSNTKESTDVPRTAHAPRFRRQVKAFKLTLNFTVLGDCFLAHNEYGRVKMDIDPCYRFIRACV